MRNIDSTGRRMTMKRLTKDEARRIASRKAWPLRAEPGNQAAQIIDDFLIEPIGSPLVRVLFTKGMIAADFLGDPTSTGLDMPSQTHRASGGLTAGSCGPFLFGCNRAQAARHLHGSTKLDGEGRLWMMRCAPSISIVA